MMMPLSSDVCAYMACCLVLGSLLKKNQFVESQNNIISPAQSWYYLTLHPVSLANYQVIFCTYFIIHAHHMCLGHIPWCIQAPESDLCPVPSRLQLFVRGTTSCQFSSHSKQRTETHFPSCSLQQCVPIFGSCIHGCMHHPSPGWTISNGDHSNSVNYHRDQWHCNKKLGQGSVYN